jgi:hypothetical protein
MVRLLFREQTQQIGLEVGYTLAWMAPEPAFEK